MLQRALDVGNDIELLDRAVAEASDIVGPMRGLFDYPHLPRELKQCKELRFKLQEWVDVSEIRALFEVVGSPTNPVASIRFDLETTAHQPNLFCHLPSSSPARDCRSQRALPRSRGCHRSRRRDTRYPAHRGTASTVRTV